MFFRTRSLISVGALVFGAVACSSGSTPSSNTPASASSEPSPADESTPEALGAASATGGSDTSAGAVATPNEPTAGPVGRATPPEPVPPETGSASTGSHVAGTPTAAPLNDAQIAAITDSVNSAEIEQAQLAKATTKNPEVRRFATMMLAHHEQAQKKQAALKLDEEESPLSEQLAQESSSTRDALKAKKGAEFDRAYLEAQVDAHQKVLNTIQHDLRPQARSPALQSYLAELEPTVSRHLEEAQSAQQKLAARDTQAPGTR